MRDSPLGNINSVFSSTESTSTTSTIPQSAENSTHLTSSSTTSVVPSTSSSRAHSELQTLFPHHFTSNSRSASCNRNRSNSRKRKRNAQQSGTNNCKSKTKTITRKFVCLADKEQYDVPDREEQRELLVAGLGEVKVAMAENSKEKDVRDLLTEIFPKLKDSGGFELMYVESRSRELLVIPPGPDGLSMTYIASFIGQGKIYIRPIQQDLPLNDDGASPVTQKEECKNCHAMVNLITLREHYEQCRKSNEGILLILCLYECYLIKIPPLFW